MAMKRTVLAAALTIAAFSVAAQPARDLTDANAAARQHMRDVEPALNLLRDEADALSKISDIQRTLSGTPASSIDRAYHIADDLTARLGQRGVSLPHEQQVIVMQAYRMLQQAHTVTPDDYPKFRDEFHHQIVHPLQNAVFRDTQQLLALVNAYQQFVNTIRGVETQAFNALSGAALDPTRR
jgi:hypothetical protein